MRTIFATFALAALASCDQGPKTTEQAAAEIAEAPKMKAGQWRTTFQITAFDVPGAPAEMQEAMKGAMDARSDESCVTPEQAARDPRDFLKKGQDGDCTFAKFNVAGGQVDAQMTCKPKGGGTVDATMKGEIAPERIEMAITSAMTETGMPGGKATIAMKMNSVRIGDCA